MFAAAFELACGREAPPKTQPLDQALAQASLGGEPLFLAMFGLISARQGVAAASALPADRIALDLAGQELERIGRIWQAHDLPVGQDRKLHEQLSAVATLCEGLTETEAHAAIARESAALHQAIPAGQTEPARAALHEALPGEAGGIAAILPDILGEASAILALESHADGGVETIRRASAEKRNETANAVIRTCRDFLIRGHRSPLTWLEALRADAADLDALIELADAMPVETTELREVALELTEEMLGRARALPGDEGAKLTASSLNNLSGRLSDLGRREDALAAIEEAVEIYRRLAAQRPDAFAPNLASSLNNLSGCLSDLGRREDALAAIEEAVDIRRRLAAQHPDAFAPNLASSLNNLSGCLSDLGRREDALAAIEEAVGDLSPARCAAPGRLRT